MESRVLGLAPPRTAELRTIWLLPAAARGYASSKTERAQNRPSEHAQHRELVGDSAVATWVQRSRPQHAKRSSRSSAATACRHGRARAAARRQAREQWQARSLSRLLTHTARITAWCCRSRRSAWLHRAGCASEEASSVCARCQALLVLLPGCQRADWYCSRDASARTGGRTKPACVAAAPGSL